jgi:hypothetical protein
VIAPVIEKLCSANAPSLRRNGVRLAGAQPALIRLRKRCKPVGHQHDSVDVIETPPSVYARGGIMASARATSRCRTRICCCAWDAAEHPQTIQLGTGPQCHNIVVDNDETNSKTLVHIELPVHADAPDFIERLSLRAAGNPAAQTAWLARCAH